MSTAWVVHKFGGTSLADAAGYRQATAILDREPGAQQAVVVSAMAGVTDALLDLSARARNFGDSSETGLDALRRRHDETACELLEGTVLERYRAGLAVDLIDLSGLLRAIALARSDSEEMLAKVSGYGELWSARLLAAHLGERAHWLDARETLIVEHGEIGTRVLWDESAERLADWRARHPVTRIVVTGFVASTPDEVPTTLRRNGSDFSASIFGALLGASSITIWTDVDGVLSADPRRVPEAVVLDEMSYNEAMELAYFGARVLHPGTMAPAIKRGIPIRIRNSFSPSAPGTKLHATAAAGAKTDVGHSVKGFSTVDDVALVNVEGTGMVGVPGVAQRLFGALREVGVSVIMISQASSEHSICVAVPERDSERACEVVRRAFREELEVGSLQSVEVLPACSILAAVGDRMVHIPGVAAKLFSSLAKSGINVRAIAQGSSERNISVVVDRGDSTRALRAVHAGFFLSDHTLKVGFLGPGLVGSALLEQLEAQAPILRERHAIDLALRCIASSTKMLLSDHSIDLAEAKGRLEREGSALDLVRFTEHMRPTHLPHAVIIDCTADESVAARHPDWLEAGIHVITPNKKGAAGPLALYRAIRNPNLRAHYFCEATVGAGLPVLSTLRDLVRTGDCVQRIEGVLSGTLSYVFNEFDGARPFSEIVRDASNRGYTEPDPREDLSGRDVARKLVILARELGLEMELSDIVVEDLTPVEIRDVELDAFMARLDAFDEPMTRRLDAAKADGALLRYVGIVERDGRARVALLPYPTVHPFAGIQGSDNILAFTSDRYSEQHLVVRGPGAGPGVTAGGVFADLLRLAAHLGAPA